MGGAGGWELGSTIGTPPQTLTAISDRDIVILENDNYVAIKFAADGGGSSSQGYRCPPGFSEMKVTAITGTVKILRFNDQNFNDQITDAAGDASAVTAAVDDILYPGDLIVCNSTSDTFTVKFTLTEVGYYKRVGVDLIALSTDAPQYI